MDQSDSKPELRNSGTQAQFAETNWTLVLAAAERQVEGGEEALDELCRIYWYPLYAFLRRSGRSPHDAQDLIQGFFAHFLAKESRLKSTHPAKGRFRSFLLACLKNYVSNQNDWIRVRSPDNPLLSIDEEVAERCYSLEPAVYNDPALIFERRWAWTLVEQTLNRLRANCLKEGKIRVFEALSPFLNGNADRGDYGKIASELGMAEGAVRTETSRLKQRYRELLLQEVGRTVENPADIPDELQALFALFST